MTEWLLIDSNGQAVVNKEIDKGTLLQRAQIDARDFRILDPLLSYPPTILGREHAIVLNLEHIKAIVTAGEVFLRNHTNEHVVAVVEELQRLADDHDVPAAMPFEFRALEVALESICSFFYDRSRELEISSYQALDDLTPSKISGKNLGRVRLLKSRVNRLTLRIQKLSDELEQLLDNADDMNELLLTKKVILASLNRQVLVPRLALEVDTYEIEMILECYFIQTKSILDKLKALRQYIDDTEAYIKIQLYDRRNRLLQMELVLSACMVAVSIFSGITGAFGMNIPIPWRKHHGYIFKWVVLFGFMLSLSVFLSVLKRAYNKGLVGI